jgi:hypothetical protein
MCRGAKEHKVRHMQIIWFRIKPHGRGIPKIKWMRWYPKYVQIMKCNWGGFLGLLIGLRSLRVGIRSLLISRRDIEECI